MFTDINGTPRIFYIGWYIRDAQRHPDVPRLTDAQREAMDMIETIANDPAFYVEMDFQPGDIQLLNNAKILHSREAYEDHDDRDERRHLLRLWLARPRLHQRRGHSSAPASRRADRHEEEAMADEPTFAKSRFAAATRSSRSTPPRAGRPAAAPRRSCDPVFGRRPLRPRPLERGVPGTARSRRRSGAATPRRSLTSPGRDRARPRRPEAGIDVILSARRVVGRPARPYGLDMTDEMVDLARRNADEAGVANVEFLQGRHRGHIPLPDAAVDVVISNCVINLSTDKAA